MEKEIENAIENGEFYKNSSSSQDDRTLLVLVPGWRFKPFHYKGLLLKLMKENFLSGCDLLPYKYQNGPCSNKDPQDIAKELSNRIQKQQENRKYKSIYVIGHSIGALFIRQAILNVYVDNKKLPPSSWVSIVKRLILLAGTNKGFVPPSRISEFLVSLGDSVSSFFPIATLIRSCLRGSTWVTSLRMEWLRVFSTNQSPEIIQFYGSMDNYVGEDDFLEINRFDTANFFKLEGVTHKGFSSIHVNHYQAIRNAFRCKLKHDLIPDEKKRDHLIFLIHGIRDFSEWQDALDYEIEKIQKNITVIPVQYGYFNILQFLIPFERARAVRVFVDKYVQEVSKSPNAYISVAAHSHGTLVFEKAVRENSFIKVDQAYLAGSVLPKDTPWSDYNKYRVGKILNVKATRDWPVGILCNALKWVSKDLGTAGYHGFDDENMVRNYSLEGPHDVALQPSNSMVRGEMQGGSKR